MPAITNTLRTQDVKGIREDLSNLIANIDPTECPFTASAGTGPKPKNTYFEWQLDSLAAVDINNARNEGNDHTAFTARTPTTRVGNWCQISDKDLILSDTQDEVDHAGRKSEMSYQTIKIGVEMKRDVEATVLQRNSGATAGEPRLTATMLSYVRTNVDKGVGGVNPVAPAPAYSGSRTDGTTRPFTEALLKNVIQLGFTAGMKIDGAVLMVGAAQKQVVSGFTGIATRFKSVGRGAAAIVGAADVYVSDFGEITVVPNRFQRNRDAWLFDFDYIRFRDLRKYQVKPLAKTGDATKKLMVREWSLQVDNEASQALVADLA